MSVLIRSVSRKDGKTFLSLIDALADFEKLKRPTSTARKRLLNDLLGKRKRFDAVLAVVKKKAVGYAIFFETYSSFRALPTFYLEDIFILPDYRSKGIGKKLFRYCLQQAKRRGCGRMEWVVLDWNVNAIRFYDRIGAQRLREWLPYRIDRENFNRILKKK